MIISFMGLILFYFFYMLYLVVPHVNSIIIITFLAVSYVFYFGVISRKPEYSLYAFFLISLFFPRSGNNFGGVIILDELPGATLYRILQCIAAFTICLRLIRVNALKPQIHKRLRTFCLLISWAVFLTFILALLRQLIGGYWEVRVVPVELVGAAPLLYGTIFLYGCIAFITEIKQIERILLFMCLCGIELTLEVILFFHLKLDLPYVSRAIEESGRFGSFIHADFVTLSQFCLASIGSVLYFIFVRKKYFLLSFVPFLFLPIIATYQRASMTAGILVLVGFIFLSTYIRRKAMVLLVGLIIGMSIFNLFGPATIIERSKRFMEGEVRPEYFTSYQESARSRVGAWLRGIDVIIYTFPFGTGPGRLHLFMASSVVPSYLIKPTEYIPKAETFYARISKGIHITGPHNNYVQLVGTHGLLGALAIWFFFSGCFFNFRIFIKERKGLKGQHLKHFMFQVTAYSVLLGMGFWAIYYHYTIYPLILFFFFLTFFRHKRDVKIT